MSKSKSFFAILIPSATVFFSSACIMIIELVAGRLIARHLGSSLYTWTSVIGVVLSGITIGNYLGGRIADRFAARKALAVLFAVSSMACVVIILLNNIVGNWIWLWKLSLPARIFSHVALVFLVPSTLLGTISPVVAKMALDRGLPTGRTVGDIYAWGAAGSIAGTFLAGFYLIATMGTIAIIWMVGAALLVMAVLYWWRLWVLYIWAVIFILLLVLGMAKVSWAEETGSSVALREKPDPTIIYQDETPYCYVAVKQISENPDKRLFLQDKLKHSEVIMGDINNLQYFYTHIYAAITHGLKQQNEKLSVMVIGGGGYVYPQYLEHNWPASRIDVVEIDPGVTRAAMKAFGLKANTTINIITMDARNYVDQILENERTSKESIRYDFIYEDAINDYSVPYQLVTKEFNDKIAKILKDDGVYMINLIEIYNSGQFLGSIANTLEKTFSNVYILSELAPRNIRNTFVVVAANRKLDLERLIGQYRRGSDIWYLNDNEINTLKQKSREIILTDDYVPVENMLAPVVRRSAVDFLSAKLRDEAGKSRGQGKLDEAIVKYKELIDLDPTMSLLAYNEMAMMQVQQGRLNQAAQALRKAIKYNEQADFEVNIASIHFNLGQVLERLGQSEDAREHFGKAMEGYREELVKDPNSFQVLTGLANAFGELGRFAEAEQVFQQVVNLDPYNLESHYTLAKVLEVQGKYDQAIAALEKASAFMTRIGQKDAVNSLQERIEFLDFKRSKKGK